MVWRLPENTKACNNKEKIIDAFPRAFGNKNGDGFLHKHCPPLTYGSDMLHEGGSLRCSSLITAGGKRIIREKQDRYLQGALLGHGDTAEIGRWAGRSMVHSRGEQDRRRPGQSTCIVEKPEEHELAGKLLCWQVWGRNCKSQAAGLAAATGLFSTGW